MYRKIKAFHIGTDWFDKHSIRGMLHELGLAKNVWWGLGTHCQINRSQDSQRIWLQNLAGTDILPAHNDYEAEGMNEDVNLTPRT